MTLSLSSRSLATAVTLAATRVQTGYSWVRAGRAASDPLPPPSLPGRPCGEAGVMTPWPSSRKLATAVSGRVELPPTPPPPAAKEAQRGGVL